ncbi:MAG: TIGR02147 family protein [Fibrobacterales bacterium]
MSLKIKVRDYVDYVVFLNDWFVAKKEQSAAFSFRLFADAAQFKSKSHMAEIIKGKKQLSRKSILNVAHAMKLNDIDIEYFSHLVHFQTAKSVTEKNIYWSKICEMQLPSLAKRKTFREYSFLSNWYNIPIREILTVVDFNNDFRFLGKQVWPPISQKQAKEAVELLVELDMVEKSGPLYIQKSFDILVDPVVKKLAYHNYQKEIIGLGADAIDDLTDLRRYTQTISYGSNPILNNKINVLIDSFVGDLYQLVQQYPDVDEVKQLNLQVFSLSKQNLTGKKKER